jgi:hypothetical protein
MTAAAGATGGRYVDTKVIQTAVRGCEIEILGKLGVAWRNSQQHINCPYPDHADRDPSWRFDDKTGRGFCTCIVDRKSDSIFDVAMKIARLDFEAAKISIAEWLSRGDLIKTKGEGGPGIGQKHDAESLLSAPAADRDDGLPSLYLAARLNIDLAEVPMPTTKMVGLQSLAYFDAPIGKAKPHLVGAWRCAVFETVAVDGRRHAHRIYLDADGTGKADLGIQPNGKLRDPKKSVTKPPGGPSTAGCCVVWGNIETAGHAILAEGIETACAIAFCFKDEIERGAVVVLSAIATLPIEGKYKAVISVANLLHVYMASNNDWVVPASRHIQHENARRPRTQRPAKGKAAV